jgi:copper(I)-binding protein
MSLNDLAFVCACIGLFVIGGCRDSGEFEIASATVRAPVAGMDKTAAYAALHNGTDAAVVLVGASAPGVRAIEFHSISNDGGMLRMRRLQSIALEPGETRRLESGSDHLMLFGVGVLGDELAITFASATGDTFTHEFSVEHLTATPD